MTYFLRLTDESKAHIRMRIEHYSKLRTVFREPYVPSGLEPQHPLPLRKLVPAGTTNVRGDGNCLFRCLSQEIYGNEDYHDFLRLLMCDYVNKNKIRSSKYVKRMLNPKEWGTDVEFCAAAVIFGCRVFVFIDKRCAWSNMRYNDRKRMFTDESIYILLDRNHFMIVTDVKPRHR